MVQRAEDRPPGGSARPSATHIPIPSPRILVCRRQGGSAGSVLFIIGRRDGRYLSGGRCDLRGSRSDWPFLVDDRGPVEADSRNARCSCCGELDIRLLASSLAPQHQRSTGDGDRKYWICIASVDPRGGFEPPLTDSESAVLPLDDRGTSPGSGFDEPERAAERIGRSRDSQAEKCRLR